MRIALLPFAVMRLTLLACVGVLLAWPIEPTQGAVPSSSGFTESQIVSGLTDPTDMEFTPDGGLFVAEQGTLSQARWHAVYVPQYLD